jgi:protein regulator of cytokinesis 1
MENCEAVETVCIRYTKALGGNIKATGTSLGELRKEQSLPRRYELVTEFQEKLRQTYHAKLEQLTALTNRLNHFARTLGTIYFAQDILETTPATGEAAFDATAPRDVTPERFLKLEKELVRGKAEVTKRLHQLSSLFVQIDWLHFGTLKTVKLT